MIGEHFQNRKIFLNSSIESRGQDSRYLIIDIFNKCNNNCLHCNLNKEETSIVDTANVIRLINRNSRFADSLFIKGGEVTLRRDFLQLIKKALTYNFREIVVETNGRIFSYENFCKKLVDLTTKQTKLSFLIKLYGHNAEIHDAVTRTEKSFEQTIKGIKNLLSLKQNVKIKIIASKLNYKHIPETINLVKSLDEGIKIHISVTEPGINPDNFEKAGLKLTELKNAELEKAFLNNSERIVLDSSSIPFCIFPNLVELHSYLVTCNHNAHLILNRDNLLTNHYDVEAENKIKHENCKECEYESICLGFDKGYVKKIGFDGLKPFVWDDADEKNVLENLYALNMDLKDCKADALVFFSGGLDSTIAASIYAQKNPQKKIMLISYLPSYMLYLERSKISVDELMKKHPNIAGHIIIPVPSSLPKKFFLDNFKEKFRNKTYFEICLKCRAVWSALTVYLNKKFFKADTIVLGFILDDFGYTKDIAVSSSKVFGSFYEKYGIKLDIPTLFYRKSELYELAKQENFSNNLLEAFNPENTNNKTQGFCMLETLKVTPDGAKMLNELGFVKESDRNVFDFFEGILSSRGIHPIEQT